MERRPAHDGHKPDRLIPPPGLLMLPKPDRTLLDRIRQEYGKRPALGQH